MARSNMSPHSIDDLCSEKFYPVYRSTQLSEQDTDNSLDLPESQSFEDYTVDQSALAQSQSFDDVSQESKGNGSRDLFFTELGSA